MRVVSKHWFFILYSFVPLPLWTALLIKCLWFFLAFIVCILFLDKPFLDGDNLNDASPKLVLMYFFDTFTQTVTFFDLWNSINICRRSDNYVNCDHCIDFFWCDLAASKDIVTSFVFFLWFVCFYALIWCSADLRALVCCMAVYPCRSILCIYGHWLSVKLKYSNFEHSDRGVIGRHGRLFIINMKKTYSLMF